MAKTEEGGNIVFPMQVGNFPGELLRRIVSGDDFPAKFPDTSQESDEIELSLGLSLNGRFGVDPRAKTQALKRSASSISGFFMAPARNDEDLPPTRRVAPPRSAPPLPLMRTCSLPMETEEEWRKRKELQSLRRMEAKRKRTEKQQRSSNSKVPRDRIREKLDDVKGGVTAANAVANGKDQLVKVVDELRALEMMPTWSGGDKCNVGLPPPPPTAVTAVAQGRTVSQGSGSSGTSESERPAAAAAQGLHKCTEARSDANFQSSPKSEKELLVAAPRMLTERSSQFSGVQMETDCNKPTVPEKGANEIVKNVLQNMPCVSTQGDGPNGKRIEGFLYRYKKGEEVRIVCVCHGSFLSPAEFVKHAGGGDVVHPLKHIVVSQTPLL